jgi:TPR repeat protein
MDKPWYRKLISHRPVSGLLVTQAKKAEEGDAEAQFGLGLKFANGEAQDYLQAAQWYRKAADQNHSLAQFNLGMMYAQGQGMAPDEGEAVRWIRRAAEQGDAAAQFNLGSRYHRASVSGLEMDAAESRIEAYKWFQLAAAQGYKNSLLTCEPVTLRMTHDDVAEGNDRVATFVPANRKGAEPVKQ